MGVVTENTPNPRAMKFTVGVPVGGPATFTDAATADEWVAAILDLDGVVSVFMTANFVTATRDSDAAWDQLAPAIVDILETTFG
jgi:hypothetical protein